MHMWSWEEERKEGGEQSNSLISWQRSWPPRRYLYDVNTMYICDAQDHLVTFTAEEITFIHIAEPKSPLACKKFLPFIAWLLIINLNSIKFLPHTSYSIPNT